MKTLPKAAILAVLAGTIGLSAMVPASFAQERKPDPVTQDADHSGKPNPGFEFFGQFGGPGHFGGPGKFGDAMERHGAKRGGGLLDLVCSEKGAEALEIALVRLSYATKPTAGQQALFDDLKSSALTAQAGFAETCTGLRTDNADAGKDMLDRFKDRLAVDGARLDALNAVLPKFEAFYASLSDEQKAGLQPHKGGGKFGLHKHPGGPEAPAITPGAVPEAPAPTNG